MVRASSGVRHGTRRRLKLKEKSSIERFLKAFKPQDKVILKFHPASQKGGYPIRYAGPVGTVVSHRGDCYLVQFLIGGKDWRLIIRPEHLQLVKR